MLVKQPLNEDTIPSTISLRGAQNSLLLEAITHEVSFEDVMLGNGLILSSSESPSLGSDKKTLEF